MPGLGDLIDTLDPDDRLRGLQFETICKWFLTHDPGYRRELKTVWLWDEWPGRWGADAGIDLVAETHAGDVWAIQAKCYRADRPVTKHDMDKFLSESSRSVFSYRLLIATSDDLHGTARRTVQAQEKPVGLLLRSDLEHAQVDWRFDLDDLHAPPSPVKMARPHQREALEAVAAGFETYDRGQMVMACGTGKTLTALWVTERLKSDRTLVLVPSLSLLKDTLREWTAHATADFLFLPVCSDVTVRGADLWVSSTSELGFPVTTNPGEPKRQVGGHRLIWWSPTKHIALPVPVPRSSLRSSTTT